MSGFQVGQEKQYESEYGEHYRSSGGIVDLVGGAYDHRIGGDSWTFTGVLRSGDRPSLILSLDLRDPICHSLNWRREGDLPLCSMLTECQYVNPQYFEIHSEARRIHVLEFSRPTNMPFFPQYLGPLPLVPVSLDPMRESDFPTSRELYWSISDEFVGGDRFFRVSPVPFWLQGVQHLSCRCGQEMQPVACQGYPNQRSPTPIEDLLFFGEFGLYWFLCKTCSILGVIMQST